MRDNTNAASFTAAEVSGGDIYKFVMELIPKYQDLHTVLEKIYDRYKLPLIVTDISYHLLAYAGPLPCPDIYWDMIITEGTASPETIIGGYYKDGYMDRISVESEPFCVDWGVSADAPQTTCAVYVNGNMEAISSVLFIDESKKSLALTVNAALRSAAEIYLTMHWGSTLGAPAPDRAFLARLLLEDTGASVDMLMGTSFYKQEKISPGYIVIAIQQRMPVSGKLQNLRSSIKNHYPNMLFVNKDDGVYCFFSGIDSPKKASRILSVIQDEAEGKTDYVCGISGLFNELSHRAAYVEQAKLALEFGLRDSSDQCNYYFSRLYPTIICSVGYQNVMPESLMLREIRLLIEADEKNSTNFFESLKCYLYSNCDMSKAASELFLHRNSLMYRIKRCQEIMNVDLSHQQEFERFYICCRVLDLSRNVNSPDGQSNLE